jgi:hypothetical protein
MLLTPASDPKLGPPVCANNISKDRCSFAFFKSVVITPAHRHKTKLVNVIQELMIILQINISGRTYGSNVGRVAQSV